MKRNTLTPAFKLGGEDEKEYVSPGFQAGEEGRVF